MLIKKYPFMEIAHFIINNKPLEIYLLNGSLSNKNNHHNTLCKEIYTSFNSRHPKFPLIKRKTVGAALLEVPNEIDGCLQGSQMKYARRKINKAKREGYIFSKFQPNKYSKDILEINTSAPTRQDKEMSSSYLSEESIVEFHLRSGENYGVFNADKKLVAYSVVPTCGELSILSRILGHDEHIENGVMFMLVNGILNDLSKIKKDDETIYLFYDMWFGASKGLKYFKEKLGFKPYRIKWCYLEKKAS